MLFEFQRLGFFRVVSGKLQQVVVKLRAGLIIIIILIRAQTIVKPSGKPHHLFSQDPLAVSHATLLDERVMCNSLGQESHMQLSQTRESCATFLDKRVACDILLPIAKHQMNFCLNCYLLSFCPSHVQDKLSS
jgi:hypothetical protein